MTANATEPAAATADDKDLSHTWIGQATISLSDKIAKHANLRGSFRAYPEPHPDPVKAAEGETIGKRIDILEVICSGCRRPYDDVADGPCAAKIDNTHLIGGNPGERKKRKHREGDLPASAVVMAGPRISRRGVEAIVAGGAINVAS